MNDSGRMGMDRRKYRLMKTAVFLLMFSAAVIALFPFYWMMATAVKPVMKYLHFPPSYGQVNLYGPILQQHCPGRHWLYFRNSFIVTLLSTVITVCINLLCRVCLCKIRF